MQAGMSFPNAGRVHSAGTQQGTARGRLAPSGLHAFDRFTPVQRTTPDVHRTDSGSKGADPLCTLKPQLASNLDSPPFLLWIPD